MKIIIEENHSDERSTEIENLLKERDYMIQSFVTEIKNGEWSFLFFNAKYSGRL